MYAYFLLGIVSNETLFADTLRHQPAHNAFNNAIHLSKLK